MQTFRSSTFNSEGASAAIASTARYNIQLTVLPLIHPDVTGRAADLRLEFDSAAPFRHLVIDEFLTQDVCRALMAEFPEFDREHARNEMGEVGGKAVNHRDPRVNLRPEICGRGNP